MSATNKNLAKFIYDTATTQKVFFTSGATAFEIGFLLLMISELVACPEYSFHAKATVFNMSVPSGNIQLCKKRLAEAFFFFALLEMLKTYQPAVPLSSLAFSHDVDENLLTFTPTLKRLFQQCAAEHTCDIPGCRVVLGWDADCKVSFGRGFFNEAPMVCPRCSKNRNLKMQILERDYPPLPIRSRHYCNLGLLV